MEFAEIQKIWSAQNNEVLYAINEDALLKIVKRKSRAARLEASVNEIMLILISAGVGIHLFVDAIQDQEGIVFILAPLLYIGIVAYLLRSRSKRKKVQSQFDRSLLGELDQAIANAKHSAKLAKNFGCWFILPIAIAGIPNMFLQNTPLWKWFFVPGSFLLAYLVVRFSLTRIQLPNIEKLQGLRNKLIND